MTFCIIFLDVLVVLLIVAAFDLNRRVTDLTKRCDSLERTLTTRLPFATKEGAIRLPDPADPGKSVMIASRASGRIVQSGQGGLREAVRKARGGDPPVDRQSFA